MSSSSVPTVKAALVELLEAASWPAPRPAVSYGWPREVPREIVQVGGTTQGEQTWAAFGTRKRDESYRLELVVQVIHPGQSQRAATERAFALLAVIEDVLRDHPTLGLADTLVAEIANPQLREGPEIEGYAAVVTAGIGVRARI